VPDTQASDVCISGSSCPLPTEPPAEDADLDKKIAKGELPFGTYPSAQQWLAQRRLYERLTEEGNPYAGDPDFDSFLAQSQSNGLAAYGDLQIGLRQLFNLSKTDYGDLLAYEQARAEHSEGVLKADRKLAAAGLSTADSAYWATARLGHLQAIGKAQSDRDAKLAALQSARSSAAAALSAQNAALTGTAPYRAHEKALNALLLQTLALGSADFSPAQVAGLEAIAAACPLSEGEPVLRARALLRLVQAAPVAYDDQAACAVARPARERGEEAWLNGYVLAYPNPANEQIKLEYRVEGAKEHVFTLFNAYGQQVKSVVLNGESGNISISIVDIPSGIYWYAVPTNIGASIVGKISVNH
jgi:hypothetical protein